MKSNQVFLSNKNNLIRAAILSASTVRAATSTARPMLMDREGRGVVRLTGSYTGAKDCQIDVLITDSGIGATPQASAPVLSGAGNGQMTDVAIDVDTSVQDFTVTLRELAKPAANAEATADGVRIIAKADLAALGNGTFMRVDASTMSSTDSGRLVPENRPAGTIETAGPAWDFGALPLTADGKINPSTARVRFGDDPQVYRQYAIQRNNITVFRFQPALARALTSGAKVWNVTGGRKVTITVGQPGNRFAAQAPLTLTGNIRCATSDGANRMVMATLAGELKYSSDAGSSWSAASSNPFGGGAIYALYYDPSGDRFIAAGAAGAAAYSADGGNHWIASGATGFGSNAIYALAGRDDLILAVGASGNVSASGDSGTTWTLATGSALSDADLHAVICLPGGLFLAAGADGAIGNSDDDGATWNDIASPIGSGTTINALAIEPGTRRVVLGASSGDVYFSGDLGNNWAAANTPHAGNSVNAIVAHVGIFAAIDSTGLISIARDPAGTWYAITNTPLAQGNAITAGSGFFVGAGNDQFARAMLAETLTGIWTRYQVLYDIYGRSLLRTEFPAVYDERPGGAGWMEFQPVTGAIAPSVKPSGATLALIRDLSIGEAAPSQIVSIVCTDHSTPGAEVWSVTTLAGRFTYITGAQYGDATLSFSIAALPGGAAYDEGSRVDIQILAASPVILGGGAAAIDDAIWSVQGSVDGPQDDYVQAPVPAAYAGGLLTFKIVNGTVPPDVGTKYTLTVEGGKFKWRKDGGDYSAEIDITSGPIALVDGLSAEFLRGLAPSFVADDIYPFAVRQPFGVENLRRPSRERYEWDNVGGTEIVADFGAPQSIEVAQLELHEIPDGAAVTLAGSADNFATVAWTIAMTWSEGAIVEMPIDEDAVRYLRITVDQAGAIGWWYAGPATEISRRADLCEIDREYSLRDGALSSAFIGAGSSGRLAWNSEFTTYVDGQIIKGLVDYSKENGDEAISVIPNKNYPDESMLVVIDTKRFKLKDRWQMNSDDRAKRKITMELPLKAVI